MLESIYLPNFKKFHQTVWILPIFFILGQFWLLLYHKRPKNYKMEKIYLCSIFFCWEHLLTNFPKISSTVWVLPIFFILVNFGCFLAKKGQKCQNRKLGYVVNFHLLRGIYIPNFRKFHQTVPKIICDKRTHKRKHKQTEVCNQGPIIKCMDR